MSTAGNIGGTELDHEILATPLRGYRVWRIHNTPKMHLRAVHMAYEWEVENEAVCHRSKSTAFWGIPTSIMSADPHNDDPAPYIECACGLYAQLPDKPLKEWRDQLSKHVYASGSIAMSGRIIVCERGYKSQYATIESPVFVNSTCIYTAEIDGVKRSVECDQPIAKIWPQPARQYRGFCDEHAETEPKSTGTIEFYDADPWFKVVVRELEERYPGVSFLTWRDHG